MGKKRASYRFEVVFRHEYHQFDQFLPGGDLEYRAVGKPQFLRQYIVQAVFSDIVIGVHADNGKPAANGGVDQFALGSGSGNALLRFEYQWVMGDEQLAVSGDGFLNDARGGVKGDHDARDLSCRVS